MSWTLKKQIFENFIQLFQKIVWASPAFIIILNPSKSTQIVKRRQEGCLFQSGVENAISPPPAGNYIVHQSHSSQSSTMSTAVSY